VGAGPRLSIAGIECPAGRRRDAGSRERSCAWLSPNAWCRHGGIVCGQALMALADTAM